jgi:thiamine pyrophosphokinase
MNSAGRMPSLCYVKYAHAKSRPAPEYVIGDLDSVSQEVVDELKKMGTSVLKDEDQNSTDFEKCMHFAVTKYPKVSLQPEIPSADA